MQRKSLKISAGHSNSDSGAEANGTTEAAIVLELRDLLASSLSARGVLFGRDGGEGDNMALADAAALAAVYDIALEFHCNAHSDPRTSGVETLSRPENTALGARITEVISNTLGIRNRSAKLESAGQHSRLAFVSQGGGIIVELFFLTNPDDLDAYQRHKNRLADALANLLEGEVSA